MNDFEHNRHSWKKLTSLHEKSNFYVVDGFKKGKSSLNPVEIEELGEIKGKNLLHFQCHFGLDTLSLSRLGANATGVDISNASIQKATELSNELEFRQGSSAQMFTIFRTSWMILLISFLHLMEP